MNKWKKKYYTFRVNLIVKRLHKRANAVAKELGTDFKIPLHPSRVSTYLPASDAKTWHLARKAQWMLEHDAPNEHDVTGLDFDPKSEAAYLPGEETNESKDRNINYEASQEPGILVTFWNPTTGQIQKDMNEPGGAMALYNGSPKHPKYSQDNSRNLSEAGQYRWDAWVQYGENWRDHVPDYVAPEPVEDEDEQVSED